MTAEHGEWDEDTTPAEVWEHDDLRCDVYEAMCAAGMVFTDDDVALVAARLWRRDYVTLDPEGAPAWRALGS